MAFLALEGVSLIPNSEFGMAHVAIAGTAATLIYSSKRLSKKVARQILFLLTHLFVVSLWMRYDPQIIVRSAAICVLLICVLIIVNTKWPEQFVRECYIGLKWYVIGTTILALVSISGPLHDYFWIAGRYKAFSSEPFNHAAIMSLFLLVGLKSYAGTLLNQTSFLALCSIFLTQSASGVAAVIILLLMDGRLRLASSMLFLSLPILILLSGTGSISTGLSGRVFENFSDLISSFRSDELIYNPTSFAIISTWSVALKTLTSQVVGYGAGNFEFAYWNAIVHTENYAEALAGNFIGVNSRGGSGLLQRLIGEYGIFFIVVFFFLFPLLLVTRKYWLLLAFALVFVFRLEDIFKPDLIVLLAFLRVIARREGGNSAMTSIETNQRVLVRGHTV